MVLYETRQNWFTWQYIKLRQKYSFQKIVKLKVSKGKKRN